MHNYVELNINSTKEMLRSIQARTRDDVPATVMGYGQSLPSSTFNLAGSEICRSFNYQNLPIWNQTCQNFRQTTSPGTYESFAVSYISYESFLRVAPPKCEAFKQTKHGPISVSRWNGALDDLVITRIDTVVPEEMIKNGILQSAVFSGKTDFSGLPAAKFPPGTIIPVGYKVVTFEIAHTNHLTNILAVSEGRPIDVTEKLLSQIGGLMTLIDRSKLGHSASDENLHAGDGALPQREVGTKVFDPRIGTQEKIFDSFAPSELATTMHAVRFKHEGVVPSSKDTEVLAAFVRRAGSNTELGEARDAAKSRGLELIVTGVEQDNISGYIAHPSVALDPRGHANASNIFRRDLEGTPPTKNEFEYPCYETRSMGIGSRSVSDGPCFNSMEDAESYLTLQQAAGFRGWVVLQGRFAMQGGGAMCPFVSEYMVTDQGVRLLAKSEEY